MTKDFLNSLTLFLAVLIFALGAVLATIAWTEPTSAPPAGNIPAPINVGSQAQTKQGPLTINAVLEVRSEVYGQIFRDLDQPDYYVNPASPGIAGTFLGNVGIGTTSPGGKLDIQTSTGSVAIKINTFTLRPISATELGVYDSGGNLVATFDEGS
jgi:hypothetical protein